MTAALEAFQELARRYSQARRRYENVMKVGGDADEAFALLVLLFNRAPKVVSNYDLYDALYWNRGEAKEPDPAIIKVFMTQIRKALHPHGVFVRNTFAAGYFLELPQ